MKNLAVLILLILFTGCAHNYPINANLNLQIIPQTDGIYSDGKTASITGIDSRTEPEVVIYQITDGAAVRITNLSPPHILVSERLAGGLREQGLQQESLSPIKIQLDIKELVATVTRAKVLYLTKATSSINLIIDNRGRTLTKSYNLESNRESLSKPDMTDLEKLLDAQLSDIVSQILGDSNIQEFINSP